MKVLVAFGILGIISISRQAPTASPDDNEPVCSKNNTDPRTYPHPKSCHKYLQCVNGTKLELECPLGQQYNKDLTVCDSPRFANCKLAPDGSTTSIPPNIVTGKGDNMTTIPSNMVEVQITTESSVNITKETTNGNKSVEHADVTTENSSGKTMEKNETTTIKVETSSHGSMDSGAQNETLLSTVATDLNKRSNDTTKGENTTVSTKEASSGKTEITTAMPVGSTVSSGQINVKDEAEPAEEDSAEKEEDNKSPEKRDDKLSSAEEKSNASNESHKKDEVTTKSDDKTSTAKPGDKVETSTASKNGTVEPKMADSKEVTKSGDNASKEMTKPELGGEEERKKDDGKKSYY